METSIFSHGPRGRPSTYPTFKMSNSLLIDTELLAISSNSNKKKVIISSAAGAGVALVGLSALPASAQTYSVSDAVTEVTAVPAALGAVVSGFTVLAVGIMGVVYAVKIAKRVKP